MTAATELINTPCGTTLPPIYLLTMPLTCFAVCIARALGYHSGAGRYKVEAPRPRTRSLLLELFGSGYPKAATRTRILLYRFEWAADKECQEVGADKEAHHPARLDRCVDLPQGQRSHSSNRPRCQRTQAIPLPRLISEAARRNEVSPDAEVQPAPPETATSSLARPVASWSAKRKGPGHGGTSSRENVDPGGQSGLRQKESFFWTYHYARPSCGGLGCGDSVQVPWQEWCCSLSSNQ